MFRIETNKLIYHYDAEELLEVAREYQKRGVPLAVIVADFFHWPKQGEWKFDPVYWPSRGGPVALPYGSQHL